MRAILVTHNVPGDRKTLHEQFLSISLRRLEDLAEVLIAFLVLVTSLAPLRDGLTMEDKQVEECIEQQDDIWANLHRVQQHRLWWPVEAVRHERWLNHNQRVVDVFTVEHMAVVCCLVR